MPLYFISVRKIEIVAFYGKRPYECMLTPRFVSALKVILCHAFCKNQDFGSKIAFQYGILLNVRRSKTYIINV